MYPLLIQHSELEKYHVSLGKLTISMDRFPASHVTDCRRVSYYPLHHLLLNRFHDPCLLELNQSINYHNVSIFVGYPLYNRTTYPCVFSWYPKFDGSLCFHITLIINHQWQMFTHLNYFFIALSLLPEGSRKSFQIHLLTNLVHYSISYLSSFHEHLILKCQDVWWIACASMDWPSYPIQSHYPLVL